MRHDATTRAYVERRLRENKTKKDILRCLKCAIAREVYKALTRPHATETAAADGAELAALRKTRHITMTDAAEALNTWPSRISDIEKHRRPLTTLTNQYRNWLQPA